VNTVAPKGLIRSSITTQKPCNMLCY